MPRPASSLWHFNTGDLITASPITYAVDGKQYLAIASGTNIFAFGLPEGGAQMRIALAIDRPSADALLMSAADAQRRAAVDNGPHNPFAGNQAAIDEGRGLYNSTCTACHGANGAAGEFGPGLAIPGRSYARSTDSQIFDVIQHGIPGHADAGAAGQADRRPDLEDRRLSAWPARHRASTRRRPAMSPMARRSSGARASAAPATWWAAAAASSVRTCRSSRSLRKTNAIIDALTKEQHRVYGRAGRQPHLLAPLAVWPVVRITTADGKVDPRPVAQRGQLFDAGDGAGSAAASAGPRPD